jgi:hypothetical protein
LPIDLAHLLFLALPGAPITASRAGNTIFSRTVVGVPDSIFFRLEAQARTQDYMPLPIDVRRDL